MDRKKDKYSGCLLGMAAGSALGRMAKPMDCQMTVAVGEASIASKHNVDAFIPMLSRRFVEWLGKHDSSAFRAPDYTCITACENLAAGRKWDESGIGGAIGNGSTMRTIPVGLYESRTDAIVIFSIESSRITHPGELPLCSAAAAALVTRFAIEDEPVGFWANELLKVVSINDDFKKMIRIVAELASYQDESKAPFGECWTGDEVIARALFCCMMHPECYKEAVQMAARSEGDSDAIASIVGAWMGAKFGLKGIPKEWLEKADDKDVLMDLADRLYKEQQQ